MYPPVAACITRPRLMLITMNSYFRPSRHVGVNWKKVFAFNLAACFPTKILVRCDPQALMHMYISDH